MEPDGSTVENEHDLDDMSNVSITATTPSSLGDVDDSHDDLPNSDDGIAGAGQYMSDISPEEYADSIKSLNARLRASYKENQDAREDARRAEESEDILRTQLSEELNSKRALRAEIAQSHEDRIALGSECDSIRNELNDRKCSDPEHIDLQSKLDDKHQELTQLQLQHQQLTLVHELYQSENAEMTKRLSGEFHAAEHVGQTTIERHAATLIRRATMQEMPTSQQSPAEAAESKEAGDLDGDEIIRIIPGSDQLAPGGIPVKRGASRIHSLQAKYNPYAVRAVSLLQSDDEGSTDEIVIQKLLKQAGVIMSSTDKLEELYIPTMEKFRVTWFTQFFTKLQDCQVASLVAHSFGWMDEYKEIVGSHEEMKIWHKHQYAFLDMYHGNKLYAAILKGKNQQLLVATNRYLRVTGNKKSLVELGEVIATTFQFVQSHAETGKVLTGCSTVRPANQSDLQYALTVQVELDRMRERSLIVDVEDMFCTNVIGQLGTAIEQHAAQLMRLWPTGLCGFAFLDMVLKSIVEYSEISTLSMGHSNYNLSMRQDKDGSSYRKNRRGTAKYGERREASQERAPVPEHIDAKKQCTCCASMTHLIADCPRSDCVCYCCDKKGHMKYCCPCEICRKRRAKSNKKTGRVKAATKKAAAKLKKEKEARRSGDASCPHCNLEQGHEPGQVCKMLRLKNEEADNDKSEDKKNLEKAGKQLRDAEKVKRQLEKRLKEANKKVRSSSMPAPSREDAVKLSSSDDEGSYSVSEDDYSDDGESSDRSSRSRKSKRNNLVRKKRFGVAKFTRVKRIDSQVGSEVSDLAHVNPYAVHGYSDLQGSPWGDSSDGTYSDMDLLPEPGHAEDADDEENVHPAEELEGDKVQALGFVATQMMESPDIDMCYSGKECYKVIDKQSSQPDHDAAERRSDGDPSVQPVQAVFQVMRSFPMRENTLHNPSAEELRVDVAEMREQLGNNCSSLPIYDAAERQPPNEKTEESTVHSEGEKGQEISQTELNEQGNSFWKQKVVSMSFAKMMKKSKQTKKKVCTARPARRKTSGKHQKRPNKGSAKSDQPKAESYFATKNRTDTTSGSIPSYRKKNDVELIEAERKRMSEVTGMNIEEASIITLPNGQTKVMGKWTELPPGDTRDAEKLMHQRVIEGARTMMWRFFGAWKSEHAVEVNDVYDCVFDRDAYTEYMVDKETFRKALSLVDYFHMVGSKVFCTMVLRSKIARDLATMNILEVLQLEQQMEIALQGHISDYRSAFEQRMMRTCEMYPYNNPRVIARDLEIISERKREAAAGEGCSAEDIAPEADEDLAPGQCYGIYYSKVEVKDEEKLEEEQMEELLNEAKERDETLTQQHLIYCEYMTDRLLKNLINYGNVEQLTHGRFKDEDFIDVCDLGQALEDIMTEVVNMCQLRICGNNESNSGCKKQEALDREFRIMTAMSNHVYKAIGNLKGSLERAIRYGWMEMKIENSLQMERSAVDIALAILREADDYTTAINHWEIGSRKEEVLLTEMWIGESTTNSYPVRARGKALKIRGDKDVIHAEEYAMIFLQSRHNIGEISIKAEEDPRDQKYDQTVSLAAVAKGEQIYRSSVLYWIDKLKASEMQGPYYFEALKSLLSSEYRECELKICSVGDRKDQRLSIRKPHFSGAKGDIERLPGAPVAHGNDFSKPTIVEYKDDTLKQDNDSEQERTSFEKKAREQEKGSGRPAGRPTVRRQKQAKSDKSRHGLFGIFNKKKKEDFSSFNKKEKQKAQAEADKRSAREAKEQYVDKLLKNLQMVNKLSQKARDVLSTAEAEDVDSEVDEHRDTPKEIRRCKLMAQCGSAQRAGSTIHGFHEDSDELYDELGNPDDIYKRQAIFADKADEESKDTAVEKDKAEPVVESDSLQDSRNHLHRESVEGESGILLRDEYRHLWCTRLKDYLMSQKVTVILVLFLFISCCCVMRMRSGYSAPALKGRALPTKRVMLGQKTLKTHDIIWDTGCSDWLHGKQMKHREFNTQRSRMDFVGFGDDMEAVSNVEAGVAYPQFTVKSSHRLDCLRGANLGAGWTSRNEGFSTLICGFKGKSCIQKSNSMARFELIDKEEQPVVGKLIDEGKDITRQLGWMAVRHKGKLTHFESSTGRLISLHKGRTQAAKACNIKEAEGISDNPVCESIHQGDEQQELQDTPEEEAAEAEEALEVSDPHYQKSGTHEALSGTAPQSTKDALEMAQRNYPDLMRQFMSQEGSALKSKIDQVIVDNWMAMSQPYTRLNRKWTGVTLFQRLDGGWSISRHASRQCLMTPCSMQEHSPDTDWSGERITLISYLQAEVAKAPSTWRGKKEGSSVKQDSKNLSKEEKEVILSLFDGMGCLGIALTDVGTLDLSKHKIVSSEISEKARLICDSANRDEQGNPITDHNFPNDVMKITEKHIVDQGKIIMFAGGAPCGDFSRKRNLRMRNGKMPTTDQRSGFKGKTGILFKQMLKVWHWVKKHNPECDYFIENVVFDDMPEWQIVNETFGEPIVLNSKHVSFTARRRAYWTSFRVPESGLQDEARKWESQKHNADTECMDPGRSIVRDKNRNGELVIRPLGKSWTIKDRKLMEDTSKPVWVKQKGRKYLTYLRPNEAEQLHGLKRGCTAHTGEGPLNRLQCIGNGWDLYAVRPILKFWVPSQTGSSGPKTVTWNKRIQIKEFVWTETPQVERDKNEELLKRNILMGRGKSKKLLSSYDHLHQAMGHASASTLERASRYKVILDIPKIDWDEVKDRVCTSCDKGQQRMPDKCKDKPEEFKPIHPMQHIYADVAFITATEAAGGMRYIVCFREAPGQLRGYYAIKELSEAAGKFEEFLKEHFPNVSDRGAMEKHLLLVKPDGELGAFGEAFANVGKDYGYQVAPSLPRSPDENQAEWAVNEVKRKATTLLEENCLPTTCFPLVLKYISQIACFSPSGSHKNHMSPYEYVTDGRKISLKEMIPFGTFGWKPKTKQERTSLGWRAKPVIFLGWDSIYKRGGVQVMSVETLIVQKAKMKNRNFIFGYYWKDFIDEETTRDRHRRAIESSISRIEQTHKIDFKEGLRYLDENADVIPTVKSKPNIKKKPIKKKDVVHKYKHGQHVKTYCLEGEDTGWYSGVIDTIDSDTVQVYYADENTYTEHKVSDEKLRPEDGSIKFRINDAVSIVQLDLPSLTGRVIEIKPKKIVVYFDDKTKADYEHTDSTVKLDLEKTSRSFMTSKIPFQKFRSDLIKKYGKVTSKKVKKCWRKHRAEYCDRFWHTLSGGSEESEASIAFDAKSRKAVFMVVNKEEEPVIPKGFKDIQFISDAGVRAKWYQAVLDEHAKSEANGTFQWIPDDQLDGLRKRGISILRHVWVFKMKRDDNGHYSVYKARGCVDGSQQKQGFDYNETFAPTCREASFKALMSLSVAMDWDISQLDVGSAFTNAYLDEEVYMRCPQGIRDKPKVCKLLRALYGLKQAPRAWYENFRATLKRNGWERCPTDACLFKKQDSTSEWMYLLVYVDDILVVGTDAGRRETAEYLKENYNMTEAGRPRDFLGFEVDYVRKSECPEGSGYAILHQTRYVNEILERFKDYDQPDGRSRIIHSPWEPGLQISKADEPEEGEKIDFPYREFCGAVIYLRTRPDITYTVNKLCKWMVNPGKKMVDAAKRLLRYLSTYPDGGISYGVNRFESDLIPVEEQMEKLFKDKSLYCATDSSYGDELDHGYSTMGEFIMLNGGPLHQKSYEYKAKIPVKGDGTGLYTGSIMKSTVEAEYVALSNGASELINFSQLLGFFGDTIKDTVDYGHNQDPLKAVVNDDTGLGDRKSTSSPLSIFGDNDGSLRITRKREMTKLAKHIRAKFHHVRDLFEGGAIDPKYLNTKDQIADVLTKGLNPIDHLRVCRKFMILPERRNVAEQEAPATAESLHKAVLYLQGRQRASCAA